MLPLPVKKEDQKVFNLRIPKDQWYFMRKLSLDTGWSMNSMVVEAIGVFKKKIEKKLEKQLTDK